MSTRFAVRTMLGKKEWRCDECDEWSESGAIPNGRDFICFKCLGIRDPQAKGILRMPQTNQLAPEAASKAEGVLLAVDITPRDLLVLEAIANSTHFHHVLFMRPTMQLQRAASGPDIMSLKRKLNSLCDGLREQGVFDELK